jgi:hypothetical protein
MIHAALRSNHPPSNPQLVNRHFAGRPEARRYQTARPSDDQLVDPLFRLRTIKYLLGVSSDFKICILLLLHLVGS